MYVAAMYGPPSPPELAHLEMESAPKQVQALDNEGQIWYFAENSQVGDWLRFVEEGGTIEPYSEATLQQWQAQRAK